MKLSPRRSLVSVAALAVYLTVNIGAAALHHHHGAGFSSRGRPLGSDLNGRFLASDPSPHEDEEHCLLCTVLHLPQGLPDVQRVETVTAVAQPLVSAAPSIRSHPLETIANSRGPPVM